MMIKVYGYQKEIEVTQWSVVATTDHSITVWYEAIVDGKIVRCAGQYEQPWRDQDDQTVMVCETVIVDGKPVSAKNPWDSANIDQDAYDDETVNAENIAWKIAEHDGCLSDRIEP